MNIDFQKVIFGISYPKAVEVTWPTFFYFSMQLLLSPRLQTSKHNRWKKVREQIFCLHCLHLCSSVHNKSAQWLKSSYLWNSNKKGSLSEHLIFERTTNKSQGFSCIVKWFHEMELQGPYLYCYTYSRPDLHAFWFFEKTTLGEIRGPLKLIHL